MLGSMQVEFRVEVRRCHLSHELEAQACIAVAGNSGCHNNITFDHETFTPS